MEPEEAGRWPSCTKGASLAAPKLESGMSAPTLSVVMSVYNAAPFLDAAISSVLIQSFPDFEFLIVDDGSTDDSTSIIRAHAAKDSRILPVLRENRGLIASLNELLDLARAPLIARMDADDICAPERFAKQIRFLADHPDYGVVGSQVDHIDEHARPFPLANGTYPASHADVLCAIAEHKPVLCHPAVMFRREAVLAVGGYHAAFRHCEDLDLWLRLANITRITNLPERLLRYRHYAGQVSFRHALEQQTGAALARVAYRTRIAGMPDPTADLDTIPQLDELDALFGQAGIAREVRGQVARALLYSPIGLGGEGFDLLLRHLDEGGTHHGMWRTVARLVRFGMPVRALRLAAGLIASRPSGATTSAPAPPPALTARP